MLNLKCNGRKASIVLGGERGGLVIDQSLDITIRGDLDEAMQLLALFLLSDNNERMNGNFWFSVQINATASEVAQMCELIEKAGGVEAVYKSKVGQYGKH